MALHAIRILFLLVVLAIVTAFVVYPSVPEHTRSTTYVTLWLLVPALGAFAGVMVDMFFKRKRLQVISGLFFGILAGLVIAFTLTLVVDMFVALVPTPPPAEDPGDFPKDARPTPTQVTRNVEARRAYNAYTAHIRTVQTVKLLLGAISVFTCVSFVLQTKDDFRFLIPYVEFARETKGDRPLLLDTSVIIDGRIADIAETRFLESIAIVPRFVLAELQTIADSDEKLRRNRGRRGLDMLNRMQGSDRIDIQIHDAHVEHVDQLDDVDAKLVALAEHLNGRIVTNDYNLNKVAQLRGVDVININDLANALKAVVLPGERMKVKVIKPGEESGQGVGYLEDGTMIVIEQGRRHIGSTVEIVVTSALQTSAGRMVFGRLDGEDA